MKLAEYHHKAASLLQEALQVGVQSYNTLCSFTVKNRRVDVVFKGNDVVVDDAVIDYYIPGVPKTPQNHKRSVIARAESWGIGEFVNAISDEIRRLSKTNNVIITKTNDLNANGEWNAYLAEETGVKGTGKSHLEALGSLVFSNAYRFGVEVAVK